MSWAATRDLELADLDRRPLGVGELGHLGHVVEGLALLGVVPRPDHLVALDRRVGAHAGPARDAGAAAVGDLDARAGRAVVAPPVERALDAVALDPPADREVGAEVRAVGVDEPAARPTRCGTAPRRARSSRAPAPRPDRGPRSGRRRTSRSAPGTGSADRADASRGPAADGSVTIAGSRGMGSPIGSPSASSGASGACAPTRSRTSLIRSPVAVCPRGCRRPTARCARSAAPARRRRCRRARPRSGRGCVRTRPEGGP